MNVFTSIDQTVQVTFEYKDLWIETQYLPSGEEVINELTPSEAAKRMSALESDGYLINEV